MNELETWDSMLRVVKEHGYQPQDLKSNSLVIDSTTDYRMTFEDKPLLDIYLSGITFMKEVFDEEEYVYLNGELNFKDGTSLGIFMNNGDGNYAWRLVQEIKGKPYVCIELEDYGVAVGNEN